MRSSTRFGENAITVTNDETAATFDVENPAEEMERLRSKYGKDKDAKRYFVDMIYVGTPMLVKQLQALEVKEAKAATTAATKTTQSTDNGQEGGNDEAEV